MWSHYLGCILTDQCWMTTKRMRRWIGPTISLAKWSETFPRYIISQGIAIVMMFFPSMFPISWWMIPFRFFLDWWLIYRCKPWVLDALPRSAVVVTEALSTCLLTRTSSCRVTSPSPALRLASLLALNTAPWMERKGPAVLGVLCALDTLQGETCNATLSTRSLNRIDWTAGGGWHWQHQSQDFKIAGQHGPE